ncbi:Zinc finger CCHC domain-containing protein 7 [Buceros rhinoceros silvestris]|uniref:Zinc finger CCHC domain-containing protein 7 n=1 Tax=Buceros rhinoceros silvestris TaxID=175836 RepID=A0A091HB63_BUCRH|nr:Zinc finger CCHC domain-containing protein 7 [Buceros rhinoceros silvestris]
MFVGYEDDDNAEAYEDELYHEETSSEQSVDSEVEFHLYSQIHYSQNLGGISTLEMDEEMDDEMDDAGVTVLAEKWCEDKEIAEFIDCGSQVSEVIVLSDTPDEDSVYKSKAKKSKSSLAQDAIQVHRGSSTPNHTTAAGCHTLCPAGSGNLSPVSSAGVHAVQDVLVIDDSSEEESLVSESDHVESWMLLGANADDRDEDIMLNLEGCATPVSQG